jgi:hypothetical protein
VQPRLQLQLERELAAAASTRDSIRYAIRTEAYANPMDYATVTRLLTPIFRKFPLLSQVELAFSDRPSTMTAIRDERRSVLIRSDAPDCWKIAVHGCIRKLYPLFNETQTARSLPWVQEGLLLDSEAVNGFYKGPFAVFEEMLDLAGGKSSMEWYIDYALVFSVQFPVSGTTLVGRVAVDVRSLAGILEDDLLINKGKDRLFVVDSMGNIILGKEPLLEGGFATVDDLTAPWDPSGATQQGLRSAIETATTEVQAGGEGQGTIDFETGTRGAISVKELRVVGEAKSFPLSS